MTTTKPVTKNVGPANIAESSRARSSLSNIDYGDEFTMSTSLDETPELWMRNMFGDVPNLGQKFIWRGLLGFRLISSKSPDTIAGWRISGRGEDWIRTEAHSWLFSGNLIFQKIGDRVSVTTFLQYNSWLGHFWWPPLSVIHRFLIPLTLRRGENKIITPRKRL